MLSQLRMTPRVLSRIEDFKIYQRDINKFRKIWPGYNNSSAWTKSYATESGEAAEKADRKEISIKSEDTFASLLRHSAFMQIGNPIGKVSSFRF